MFISRFVASAASRPLGASAAAEAAGAAAGAAPVGLGVERNAWEGGGGRDVQWGYLDGIHLDTSRAVTSQLYIMIHLEVLGYTSGRSLGDTSGRSLGKASGGRLRVPQRFGGNGRLHGGSHHLLASEERRRRLDQRRKRKTPWQSELLGSHTHKPLHSN